jgi:2-isopropylmalate synthase/UPF0716 protein FxsA
MVSSSISSSIGGLATFFEIILSAIIGIVFLQNFKFALMENIFSLAKGEITQEDFLRLNLFMALGALLLIVPGFFTDIIGVLLQFEFFALMIAKRFLKQKNVTEDFKYTNKRSDDVIDVEVIDEQHIINK